MEQGFDSQRVVDNLLELRRRTHDRSGAQRLAWSPPWVEARAFLAERLAELPAVRVDTDSGGNVWAVLRGSRPESIVIGSHLDSVPDGGWLDGAFGVMAGLEVLRALAGRKGPPPLTVALVDWADEEGARFGRSLFGSSAVAGSLDISAAKTLVDADGQYLEDVLRSHGVELESVLDARARLNGVEAYLEAHIEQGPVLEAAGLPVGAVLGTFGVERHRVTFLGRSAHSGTTPMQNRQDPMVAAARTIVAVQDAAIASGGVGTVGFAAARPGIVTAVPEEVTLLVDQRHLESEGLHSMLESARAASEGAAGSEGCTVSWEPVLRLSPRLFDGKLIEMVKAACVKACGEAKTLPSGALHDATEMASCVPTAMVFASSIAGISHNREEDTPEQHLRVGAEVLFDVTERTLADFTVLGP